MVRDVVANPDCQIERRNMISVLVGSVRAVDGVTGADEGFSSLVDDTSRGAEPPLPWTAITPGVG